MTSLSRTTLEDEETIQRLRDFFYYTPQDGALRYKEDWGWGRDKDTRAGWTDPAGRWWTKFERLMYPCSRLIIAIVEGSLSSTDVVDHANGDHTDDRWVNLRVCRQGLNVINACPISSNRSGIRGVEQTLSGKYRGSLMVQGKFRRGPVRDTPEEAILDRLDFALKSKVIDYVRVS